MTTTSQVDPRWIRTAADKVAVAAGCYVDLERAERVREFFRTCLVHSKGEWAGKPFDLLDWQWNDIVAPLFGWRRPDGTRRFTRAWIEVPKKNGKALALDTPIPTPTGWTTQGELRPGDAVFDETGAPCKVVAVTETMLQRPCYRLTFSDGCEIVADAEHEWLTTARRTLGTKGDRSSKLTKIRTTAEIARAVRVEWNGSPGANHSIAIAGQLQLPEAELPIPPYALGAWLGDGHSAGARLTCADKDAGIIAELAAIGVTADRNESSRPGVGTYTLGKSKKRNVDKNATFNAKLRVAGLLDNKHIPREYFRASQSQRLSLLQGLMDTDGCCSKAGQCEFTSISRQLAEDVVELLRTLGIKPLMLEHRATLRGRDIGPKYRVCFFAFRDTPVFKLQRKAERQKARPKCKARSESRHIISVIEVPSVPVRCIQVDSPSHLYLAGTSLVPTHNSTMVSGIALYMLLADGEAGAEVYSCAVDRDQAGIVFNEAANMVKQSPYLAEAIQVNKSQKLMRFDATNSKYEALASDSDSSEGKNASAILCDEVHAWRDAAFFDSLIYSGRARKQPLFLCATTAGDDITGVGGQEHERAEAILNGTDLSTHVFSYIASAPEADPGDWKNPELWAKANPSYGITISPSAIAEDCAEAEKSPRKEIAFKRYTLNRWCGGSDQWLSHDLWDSCGQSFDPAILDGAVCYAGIDLSRTRDLSSVCYCFPMDDLYYFLWRNYIPKDLVVEKEKEDKASYQAWINMKMLDTTEGKSIKQATIREHILGDVGEGGRYILAEAGFDPYNAEQLCNQQLAKEDGLAMVAIAQTMANMGPPTTELQALLLQGRIRHGGNPLVRWCIGGCSVYEDSNGNIRPVKRKSTTRIDPIVTMVMALGRAMANAGQGRSYYESHSLEIG